MGLQVAGVSVSKNHIKIPRKAWNRVRKQVLNRDGWRCRACGRRGRLEVDHITPLQRDPRQDPLDPSGLQTLCVSCHIAKTRSENKKPDSPKIAAWKELVQEMLTISQNSPKI